MKNFIFILFFLSVACAQKESNYYGFSKPSGLENSEIIVTDSTSTKIITITEPQKLINASTIIEDIKYLPLETTSESLIAFYSKIIFHNDRIYILDNLGAEAVFIYDINGKSLKTIGQKGEGPEEYSILLGMGIDKKNEYLMIYDNGKRKMMYYDLEGEYIKKENLPFLFGGQFDVLSDYVISATNKSNYNVHLEDFDQYRLIFTDSLGNIQKFALEYDNNNQLRFLWSKIFLNDDELLFYPQFTSSIYSISDTIIKEKYRIDCQHFSAFDLNILSSFNNNDELEKYWYSKTNLAPYIAENKDHLYFCVKDKKEGYHYFYDKKTGNHIGLKKMNYDIDFFNNFMSNIFSYKDYFIGKASFNDLNELKKKRDLSGKPLSDKMNHMIENMDEEDNDVLIFFKIKSL